jgi:hypothetical protein
VLQHFGDDSQFSPVQFNYFSTIMTTIALSCPKCLGFYSQGLQNKLAPYIDNGQKLTLDDAIRLIGLASEGSWWSTQTGRSQRIGKILNDSSKNAIDTVPFDGFDSDDSNFLDILLNLEEWLALARWTSELAELRLNDYTRAKVSEMAAQSPKPWKLSHWVKNPEVSEYFDSQLELTIPNRDSWENLIEIAGGIESESRFTCTMLSHRQTAPVVLDYLITPEEAEGLVNLAEWTLTHTNVDS